MPRTLVLLASMGDSNIILNLAIAVPGFLLAIVCHEAAHAYMALKFGDTTAKDAGRLTLNPMAHVDPFGTVIFPGILLLMGMMPFGWARPVPINASKFKKFRPGIFWVSFAGPAMNLILGTFSAFLLVLIKFKLPEFSLQGPFMAILQNSIYINFILAIFNLIPLPPLDGSQMVTSFLSFKNIRKYEEFARYTPMIFIGILIAENFLGIPIMRTILAPAAWGANKSYVFFQMLLSYF